jgi:uncharacterized protein (DUF39 family)
MPVTPAGTISVTGDLKRMSAKWLVGASIQGYGCSLSVGLGVPIPILNEEMAGFTGVSDGDLFAPIVDYSNDYPNGTGKTLGQASYAELRQGSIQLDGKTIQTVPLSSMVRAREIATMLKDWISKGKFTIGEPQATLPSN